MVGVEFGSVCETIAHAYVNGEVPPIGVAVMLPDVIELAFAVLLSGEVPAAVAENEGVRSMFTETSTVYVALTLSVTVHREIPVRVSGSARLVALKVVVAALAESIVIPEPPDNHVQA